MMLHTSIITTLIFVCLCQACPNICTCRETHADCYGRQLQSIPSDLPISVKILELQENMLQDLDGELLTLLQNLESLYLTRNQITEIKPQTFANMSSLQSISLNDNQIEDIAADGFYNLSSLQILDLSDNQISNLSERFQNIPSLQRLNLNSNRLTSLSDDSFRHLRNLTYLVLSNNQISVITKAAFQGMDKLSYLKLSGNPLTAADNLFQSLEYLTFLDISDCDINRFPAGLPWTLGTLNISNNYLTVVQAYHLASTHYLKVIDLDDNEIRLIDKDAFSKTLILQMISVNGNRLSQLPFQIPKTVVKLYANWNRIQRIEQYNFVHDSALSVLSLYSNSISSLEPDSFSRLTNLTTLNLGLNKISTLKSFTFQGLRELTSLNLEQNPISALEGRAFSSLFKVKALKMSNITSATIDIAENVFLDMPSLNSLDLQASPSVIGSLLRSVSMLRSLHSVKQLNLMSNGLRSLPSAVWRSMYSLESISLSDNEWECDDKLLPLKSWLDAKPKTLADEVVCAAPGNLQGRSVADIDPKEFTAATTTASTTTAKQATSVNDTSGEHFTTEGSISNVTDVGMQNGTDDTANETSEDRIQPTLSVSLTPLSTIVPSPAYSVGHTMVNLDDTRGIDSQELTATPVIQSITADILSWSNQETDYQIPSSFVSPSTFSINSKSVEFASLTVHASITIEQTSTQEFPQSTLTWPDPEVSKDNGPYSYNSKGDNRLPTFSASMGSRMQVTIIGVAVSLLALVTALLVSVAVVRCRQKRKRLDINGPSTAPAQETSDTVFIVRHMVCEPPHAPDEDEDSRHKQGKKLSTPSLSSSTSSRKGQRCNKQQSSASSSSMTSFDCVQGSKDDDSEMLMYSWN